MEDAILQYMQSEQAIIESDRDNLRRELLALWYFVHEFVESTRGMVEPTKPSLYSKYDDLCTKYGETARQAVIE